MKKILVMVCTAMMLLGLPISASAAISPTATPVPPSETVETSPKTADSSVIVVGLMTVILSAGAVAVSLRKSK